MPKVLHVITSLGRGGVERWILSLLTEIPRSSCAMDICCKGEITGDLEPVARELGANTFLRPLRPTQVGFIQSFRTLVREGGYNLVHNHLQAYAGLVSFACRGLDVPVVSSFHCTAFPAEVNWLRRRGIAQLRNGYAQLSVRYALSHSAMSTGCSRDVVQSIQAAYGRGEAEWRVLHYGVDLPPKPSARERRELRLSMGWKDDAPVIVHVGRFAPQKNHLGLLEVFATVVREIPEAKLLLLGEGALRSQIEAAACDRGLSSSVRFLGNRDDVSPIVSRCDLFLFPSFYEGLPVAALEASAAGLPVVAAKIPGVTEIVQDGASGFLHPPQDVENLGRSVVRLLSEPPLAARLGETGREYIAKNFSKQSSAAEVCKIYDECLSKH